MICSVKQRFVLYVGLCFFSLCCLLTMYKLIQQQEGMVLGWEMNVSRNISLYVQSDNTLVLSASELCRPTPKCPLLLVVVVCSSVPHFDRRNAIRETWASNLNPDSRVAFLLGRTQNVTIQACIEEESNTSHDIIQEDFIDSYNNLTLKSVMMLKWVQQYCDNAKFLMKTDDDMFVNLGALNSLLRSTTRTSNLLLGSLICNAKPILNPSSKWYTPPNMYYGELFPNYLSGTGYVMSGDVVTKLYNTALETLLIHIEDVYITGICAKRANIRPRNHPGFTALHHKISDTCNPHYLTNHKLTVTDQYMAWIYLLKCPPTGKQITAQQFYHGYNCN